MRIPSFSAVLLCLTVPAVPLAAQEHPRAHGRLGIMLDGGDSLGVQVRGVLPHGPAQAAGLERGDLLTRFNGTPVTAADKVVELARSLAPGDTVRLEYRRDGQTHTATVVAGRMGPQMAMAFRRMGPPPLDFGNHGPDVFFLRRHARSGLDLVPMSPDLGEYFGTSEGLLVVKPPADSTSPLKAGDVLLAIDGRKPRSVPHALAILRSYAPGEKAKLEVIRKKQRTTLTWTAPARHEDLGWEDGVEHSAGPEPAELFDLELPALSDLDPGET